MCKDRRCLTHHRGSQISGCPQYLIVLNRLWTGGLEPCSSTHLESSQDRPHYTSSLQWLPINARINIFYKYKISSLCFNATSTLKITKSWYEIWRSQTPRGTVKKILTLQQPKIQKICKHICDIGTFPSGFPSLWISLDPWYLIVSFMDQHAVSLSVSLDQCKYDIIYANVNCYP